MLSNADKNKIQALIKRQKLAKKAVKVSLQRMIDGIITASKQAANIQHNSKPLDIVCSVPASNITYATR